MSAVSILVLLTTLMAQNVLLLITLYLFRTTRAALWAALVAAYLLPKEADMGHLVAHTRYELP